MPEKYETAILQDMVELHHFIQILRQEGVKSYLEIGSKHGGSLWHIGRELPFGSRIVAVDLPHGDGSFKESQVGLERCAAALYEMGYDVHLILGDSTSPGVVEVVRQLSPFDAVFIDANHTLPYIRKDWANYGPMGRIIAFHDVGWVPRPSDSKKMPIEVPIFWEEIKQKYRHQEFKLHHTKQDNGIGVLWRG